MCKHCVRCKIDEDSLVDIDCVSHHTSMSHTKYPEEIILILSSFVQKLQLKQGGRVSISLWSIALQHLTWRQKYDRFWLPGAKSSPTVYKMYSFAAIIFRCHYTLNQQKSSNQHINLSKLLLMRDGSKARDHERIVRHDKVLIIGYCSIISLQNVINFGFLVQRAFQRCITCMVFQQ